MSLRHKIYNTLMPAQMGRRRSALDGFKARVYRGLEWTHNFITTGDPYCITCIAIEISTACNRRCPYCPVSEHPRNQQIMDDETFDLVVKRIKEYNYTGPVSFVMYNEPLLVAELASMIALLKWQVPKCRPLVVTNGDLLNSGKCRELFTAGAERIVVSHHPPFNRIWEEKIASLIRLFPGRILLYEVGGGRGGTGWTNRGGSVPNEKLPGTTRNQKRCIDTQWFQIDIAGNVLLCCNDFFKKNIMGSVRTDSIKDIWEGYRFSQLRKDLSHGKFNLPICRACSAT